jgi:serine/threonine-protein kinase RsbW
MRMGSLTLRIDSQLDHVFLIGLAVRAICQTLAIDADTVELCVVEAVNNAIEHAYGDQPGHAVEVDLDVNPARLQIVVRDRGRAMDWTAACVRADAYALDTLAEGGRGLFIMRSLMDHLSYRSANGWNVITMVKQLPAATVAAAALPRSS